jgi:O-antigen/teichoic acid export membrane protein
MADERFPLMAPGWLAANILSLTAAQLAVKAVNVLVSIALVRYLGAGELGRYAYVLAFAYPFGVLADFGLTTYTIRAVSRDRECEPHALGLLRRALLLLAGLGWVGLMGTAVLTHDDRTLLACLALAGAAPLVSAAASPWLVRLIVRDDLHLLSVYQVAASLLGSAAILTVLATGGSTPELLAATVTAGGVSAALARNLAGAGQAVDRVPWTDVVATIRRVLPFGIMMLGYALYYRIDMVMLQWLREPGEVGLYAAAYRFLDLGILLTAAVTAPFFTRLSAMAGDAAGVRTLLDQAWTPLLAVGLPVIVGTACAAEAVTVALFGDAFREAGPLLAILAWGGLPLLLISLPNHALIASDRVWALAGVYGLSVAINVAANLALIPLWGAAGASLATVVCEMLNLVLVLVLLRRRFGATWPGGGVWRVCAAAAMMAAIMRVASPAHALVQFAAGGVVYVGCLWGLGFGRSPDLVAVKRLFIR